ncbi:MAG: D-alanyl-D-alanine carboxypeptidase [Leifsonia xyli]|nr:MAG: D-alanyl-D-alanine carboxypeptidase [Leifsonia xyli]
MPPTRRQIYRRRRITVFGGLLAVLTGIAYLPLTLFAPVTVTDARLEVPSITTPAAAETSLPGYGASALAAIGYDGLLAQAGSTEALPMASITKLVTALTVLDAHPITADDPGPEVTMTNADVRFRADYIAQNGSVAPVTAGWVFTERELLEIMLIDSANNYSKTLATWAFGSVDAYLTAARSWLDAHGLSGVTVADTSGLDPRSTASATDLVALGKLALADPVLAEIVGTKSIEIHDIGTVKNTNGLIGKSGIDGIKTGTLDSFGANLLFSSAIKVGSRTIELVGVVLGGPDHATINGAIEEMVAQAKAGFHEVQLVQAGDAVARYTTPWDATARAVAGEDASLVVWGATAVTASASVDGIRLGEKGDRIGSLVFTAGTQSVTVPLKLSTDVDDPGPWWRLGHPAIIFGMS